MKIVLNFLVAVLLLLPGCSSPGEKKIIGIKIYDYHGNYDSLATAWNEIGINTAYVSEDLAGNRQFRTALKARNIKIYVIFPVFQDPEALKGDSTLASVTEKGKKAREDWVEFVCPSRKNYRLAKTTELHKLIRSDDPDGISLDFIRQFVYWEMIYPDRDAATIDRACYCDSCINGFLSQFHLNMPDTLGTTELKAEWIDGNCKAEWNNYRCGLITSIVMDLSSSAHAEKPDIKINFHAVPWREGDFGNAIIQVASQDLREVSRYVDYISPMCYSQMVKRDPGWIADVTGRMDKIAQGKILPSIQVIGYYNDMRYSTEDFSAAIDLALAEPSRGVIFFSWPLLASDPSRINAIKAVSGRK